MKPSAARLALPLLLLSALFFGGAPAAAGSDAPANDASFTLEVDVDGRIPDLDPLPAGLPAASSDPRGVQIAEGKVVEQSTEKLNQPGKNCIAAWGVCDYHHTVTGTYGNGHFEILTHEETAVTFNGEPASPGGAPIAPGTITLVSEMTIEGDYNAESGAFVGGAAYSSQSLESQCDRWDDLDGDGSITDYDIGGICLLDKYDAGAKVAEQYKAFAWVRGDVKDGDGQKSSGGAKSSGSTPAAENVTISVVNLTGDIEYRPKDEKDFRPLTPDVVLKEGDTISTGFESQGRFRIGQREFAVGQLTELRIDQFLHKENLEKTILYLNIGSIRVKEKHTDAPRGDFHIETPGANSAPRGTEFIVSVAKDGATTTYVVEGAVVFQDSNEKSVDILAGNKASVAKGGGIKGPEPYTFGETAFFPTLSESGGSSMTRVAVIGAVVLAALLGGSAVFLFRRRRALQPA